MAFQAWPRFFVLLFLVSLVPFLIAGHHPADGGGGSGAGGAIMVIGVGVFLAVAVGFFAVSKIGKRQRKSRKRKRT